MHIYCKTLYWTLLNYLQVYRSLSTGMFQVTNTAYGKAGEVEDNGKQALDLAGPLVDKICEAGMEIAKTIPFAETAITAIEGLIGIVWDTYKDMVLE